MTIHLPEDLERYLQTQVQTGRFASENEAIAEAVRLLQQRETEEPAWQRVLEIMNDVPDEIFNRIPADSSAQLDHYLYGTPKRPTS
jgi:putative addiction module CopG family antidote